MGEGTDEKSSDEDSGYKSTLIIAFVLVLSTCALCSILCAMLSYWHRRRREKDQQRVQQQAAVGTIFVSPPPNPATMVGWSGSGDIDKIVTGHAVPYEKYSVHRLEGTLYKAELLESYQECPPVQPDLPQTIGNSIVEENVTLCEICCDNTATIVLLPCGHGDLCKTCTMAIWQRSGGFCPVCRQQVQRILELEEPLEAGVVGNCTSVKALRIAPCRISKKDCEEAG